MALTVAARCLSLPSHIVVVAASASARLTVLAERTSPVLSNQRALPSTACELLNTVGRRQAVARGAFSIMSQKDLLVDLPWFQFLSSVQGMSRSSANLCPRLTCSQSIRKGVLIAAAAQRSPNRPKSHGAAQPILWERYGSPEFGSVPVPRLQRKSRIMYCPDSRVRPCVLPRKSSTSSVQQLAEPEVSLS